MIQKAKLKDAKAIAALIGNFAQKDLMLARSADEIAENIRDFFVLKESNKVCGCIALHICASNLAEIRSLAVEECSQKKGIGAKLIDACIKEAKDMGIEKIFALTYVPDFFSKFNFTKIDKSDLPHKIWNECINCPKFPGCDETAMIRQL